jgi:hypothetical protein
VLNSLGLLASTQHWVASPFLRRLERSSSGARRASLEEVNQGTSPFLEKSTDSAREIVAGHDALQ